MNSSLVQSWHLRPAAPGDCKLYWEWANDAQVRSMAFHSEPIAWESHEIWFGQRLRSPRSRLFILEDEAGVGVGQVRFDLLSDGVFEIDISVCKKHRGRGVSRRLIEMGEDALLSTERVTAFHAVVKPQNEASLALFRSVGYQERGMVSGPGGQEALLLAKNKP